jgi:hypothetical protein
LVPTPEPSDLVVKYHIYRPTWPSVIGIALVILIAIPAVVLIVAVFIPSFRLGEALLISMGFDCFVALIMGILGIAAFVADLARGASVRIWRDQLNAVVQKSPAEFFELRVISLALKRNKRIPLELASDNMILKPPAVFLASSIQQRWPMPQSVNMPFEPLPLGRDPSRAVTYLEEFVGLKPTGEETALSPPVRLLAWYRDLPPLMRQATQSLPFVLFFAWLWDSGGLSDWLMLSLLALYAVPLAGMYFRTEIKVPSCWLFPGLIAIKSDGRLRVSQRGCGTLWYDAPDKKLWVPTEQGEYATIDCEPRDGLLAIWAWLNTADPPKDIHLDDIS